MRSIRTLTQAWADGFTRESGVKVILRNGGDTELGNQIVQEGAASPADVFLTENSPAMALVDAAGLFAPLGSDILALVPDNFRSADGRWVGVAARTTVFAYNKSKLTPAQLPKSLMDLADPSWKGRWAASPAGVDFQAIVGAMLELKGEAATAAWLKAMKQNATAYRGNGAALKAVNAGEIDGAVIYHYYYFGDQAKTGENSNNTALHYFRNEDPGAFVSISGGGVLASSKHPSQAQAFLKWIVGPTGQKVLQDRRFLRICGRDRRPVQSQAGAARRSARAQGRAVQAQQQEGHRPDDRRRPAVIARSAQTVPYRC